MRRGQRMPGSLVSVSIGITMSFPFASAATISAGRDDEHRRGHAGHPPMIVYDHAAPPTTSPPTLDVDLDPSILT